MSVNITFYGHACFGIEHNGKHILFDPFISGNDAASDIDIGSIPCDVLLLSHGHADHVLDAESIAKRKDAKVIANFEVANWIGSKGADTVQPMNHGGSHDFGFGSVKMVNAIHTSSLPDGSYGGNPAGFVVSLKNGPVFYYSGDTALTYDMKLIAEEFDLDFAFLCLGDNFTMGAKDTVKAAQFVNTNKVIGMHFDTFPPIEIDHAETKNLFETAGLDLTLMKIGEKIEL